MADTTAGWPMYPCVLAHGRRLHARCYTCTVCDAPLALASGITPENALNYAADVDCFMVATGINPPGDFYNIDPQRLRQLLTITRTFGATP